MIAMVETSISCENPECNVAQSGKCLEGLAPPSACTHYGKPAVQALAPESGGVLTKKVAGIALSSGDYLDGSGADRVMKAGASRLIATIGPNDAGKTTLIASLYEAFLRGPFAQNMFGGSATLIAFERQCHLARAACRRTTPRMERSRRGLAHYFHLRLVATSANRVMNLLLADRSGEDYKAVRDNLDNANDFIEIRRADYVTILVDGRRLIDNAERHNVISEIKMILQGLVEARALGINQRIGLALSKYDLVHGSDSKDRVLRDYARLVSQVKELFGDKVRAVDSFHVAAVPHDEAIRPGYGLDELLAAWLEPIPFAPHIPLTLSRPMRVFARLRPTTES